MKTEKQYQNEYLKRLSFDNCMNHNEWIIEQIELKLKVQ